MIPYWLEFFLSPFSAIFGFIVYLRNRAFDEGYFKTQKFPVPIISIGNLTAGGTGKTPVVAYLTESLKAEGKKVAIVSRGYRGIYKSEAEQVDIRRKNAASFYGDEPVWFAEKCQVPVFVGRRRVKAIELCLQTEKPDVIIADDGFQHRWFERTKDVVLLDVNEKTDLLLPAGRWREPLTSLKRADIVILTKTNFVSADALSLWEEKVADYGFYYSNGNLFKADYDIDSVLRVRGQKPLNEGDGIFLGSSIARPESFRFLMEKKYKIIRHWIQKDHSLWAQSDIDEIEKLANAAGCPHFVLTEKDYVKLKEMEFLDLNLWLARLRLTFTPTKPSLLEQIRRPSS